MNSERTHRIHAKRTRFARDDLQIELAITLVQPNGSSAVGGQKRMIFPFSGFQRVNMSARVAIRRDLMPLRKFFSQTHDAPAQARAR